MAGAQATPLRFEPPYGVIAKRLRQGYVIPFLGAGASQVGRPQGRAWDPQNPEFLPSGSELSTLLAEETSFPLAEERRNLATVASYYHEVSGRRLLRERLREIIDRPYSFGPLHSLLASVSAPLVIVSTNYDTLLEQAFRAAGRPYHLVAYPADRKDVAGSVLWWPYGAADPTVVPPNELDIDLSRDTVIFKMHGTIVTEAERWDSFVITEEDYIEFLSRMSANAAIPSLFYPYFRERSFLFLGYGLRDWNLRVVLRNVSKYLNTTRPNDFDEDEVIPSWAIQSNPSELERRLWARKNVNIFDLTIDEFIAALRRQAER